MAVGFWQVVIVVLVIGLLFGSRLGRLGRSLGRGARGLRRMLQSATGSPADKGEPATPDWVSGAAQVARAANTLRKGVKLGRLIR